VFFQIPGSTYMCIYTSGSVNTLVRYRQTTLTVAILLL